jgi:hypothetical protein
MGCVQHTVQALVHPTGLTVLMLSLLLLTVVCFVLAPLHCAYTSLSSESSCK